MPKKTFAGRILCGRMTKGHARLLRFEQCEDRRMFASFVVTSLMDNGDGDKITLREAIDAVNLSEDIENFITFSTNPLHQLNGGVILLSQAGFNAGYDVFRPVTIDASMLPQGLTIDASSLDSTPNSTLTDGIANDGNGVRVLHIEAPRFFTGFEVSLIGLKITGGDSAGSGGGIEFRADGDASLIISDCKIVGNNSVTSESFDGGGGISFRASGSSVLVERSQVSGNQSVGMGGGVFFYGSNNNVEVIDSVISGNRSTASKGGGLYARLAGTGSGADSTTVTIDRSTLEGNTSQMAGGGLFAFLTGTPDDKFNLLNSTLSGNHALLGVGGGAYVCSKFGGQFEATNSTFSYNEALDPSTGKGGGIAIVREHTPDPGIDSTLRHLTITNNRSADGGGLFSDPDLEVRTVVSHSIISGNFNHLAPPNQLQNNLGGRIEVTTSKYNFFGTGGSASRNGLDITNILNNNDPKLGPLVYSGGPLFIDGSKMLTHAPIRASVHNPGSMAIDAGNTNTSGFPQYDQRGTPWVRVYDGPIDRIDIGAIEWQVNLLIGDYNFNGVVDAADYTVWRDTLGSTTDLRADGDNNGIIDLADYALWKTRYGSATFLVLADFNNNGATDLADYYLWSSTEGSTTDLRADCNEDGVVDDSDFDIWFDTFGSTLEIGHFGLLSGMFDPDAPPTVVGFALSLPNDAAVDFANKVGSGEQIRSVPLTVANTLSVTFSQDVVVTQGMLQITNLDGTSPTVSNFSYDATAQTATWTFTSILADGRFVVRLSDSVENLDGDALDGEFFNPTKLSDTGTAMFPSGDGDDGGEFRFRFTVLSSDWNHDNVEGAINYQNWQSTEPGMIIVSTTADDWDAILAFGDVSLREAVNYANTAGTATAIQLPAGRYVLTRIGTEGSESIEYNDLDVKDLVKIQGAGPGMSIVDATQFGSSTQRAFDVISSGDRLTLRGVTIAHGIAASDVGLAVRVGVGGGLDLVECALVNHTSLGGGSAIYVDRGELTIRRSVISDTQNNWTGGAAIYVVASSGSASITVGESIFALNSQYQYPIGNTTRNIQVVGNVTKTNEGRNLYDDASGGFFDTTSGIDDHLGSVNYVVTSVADTFNHTDDLEALSLREAVDKSNTTAGAQTIWVPAWRFMLTRDRGSNATDTDVSYGDIDVKDSAVIRGVAERTRVDWKPGVVDKVFDLLGDFNNDGQADYGTVSAADYTIWQDQNGSSGAWEQFAADADDDGDVDANDYSILQQNFGHTLTLAGIEL